jgi:hypothetical protein
MAASAQKSAFAAIKAAAKIDAAISLSFVAWREVLLRDVFPTGANAEADAKANRATTKRIIIVVFHCVAVTLLLCKLGHPSKDAYMHHVVERTNVTINLEQGSHRVRVSCLCEFQPLPWM